MIIMTILFILKSAAIAIPIVLAIATLFCIVVLSSGPKEQDDEEQMKWLTEHQKRSSTTYIKQGKGR